MLQDLNQLQIQNLLQNNQQTYHSPYFLVGLVGTPRSRFLLGAGTGAGLIFVGVGFECEYSSTL